jgi:hypothetical protein
VTKQSLQRLLESGSLRRHRSSRQEIAGLLAVAARDDADARVTQVSLDRRFATAYSGALQLATVVLAASGLRVAAQRGHHAVTWQALPELMGDALRETAIYFDSCRALRNTSDYDRAGVVSASEVEELLREAAALRAAVLGWLAEEHPRLASG